MASVAEVPHTIQDANDLLDADDPPFRVPTQPWPAGAYVPIGGGTSGNPLSEAHWDSATSQFVSGRVPSDPLDLTQSVLKTMTDLADSLAELQTSPTHGNGRLSAEQAELFDTGTFVLIGDGKAYYKSNQDPLVPPATSATGEWVTGVSPGDAGPRTTGVLAGTPGSWIPNTAAPDTIEYANALAAGAPGNGFQKPAGTGAVWTEGQHVLLADNTTTLHWDNTTSTFLAGVVPAAE